MAEQQVVKKKSIFAKIKSTFGELKKVTWPTFKTVMKATGVVVAVSLFFLVVAMGFDGAMALLYKLLTGNIPKPPA